MVEEVFVTSVLKFDRDQELHCLVPVPGAPPVSRVTWHGPLRLYDITYYFQGNAIHVLGGWNRRSSACPSILSEQRTRACWVLSLLLTPYCPADEGVQYRMSKQ